MARATVTVRELKNKETGLDLSVTSYKETKGMLGSTYEYQVMVVSNLSCFKSPKHKDTDNVQFTAMKKLNDFEDMHNKFNTKYSGTAFPQLPKKVLMMNDSVAKERRNNLDHLIKYLACTPKLCTDSILLEFLGVSPMKAGKLKKMEVSESIVDKGDNSTEQKDEPDAEREVTPENNDVNLFDDDAQEVDDDDLFGADEAPADTTGDLKLFDEPDFSGALEEGEDLFIEGSRSDVKVTTTTLRVEDNGDKEDLFSDDDDLDEIMKMNLNTKEKVPPEPDVDAGEDRNVVPVEAETETASEQVNVIKQKPALKAKPAIPKRKDQAKNNETEKENPINEFDGVTVEIDTQDASAAKNKPKPPLKQKPDIANKPALNADKPALKPKPGVKPKPAQDSTKADVPKKTEKTEVKGVDNITEDDIMKYIQENTSENADDLDLFS